AVATGAADVRSEDRVAAGEEVLEEGGEVGPRLALRPAVRVDNHRPGLLRRVPPRWDLPLVEGLVVNQLRLDELRERQAGAGGVGKLTQFVGIEVPDPNVAVIARSVERESQLTVVAGELECRHDPRRQSGRADRLAGP